ncbi:ABC transporter substrate-binding protein [Nocardioides gansuensis]|uniref:ABC transporter substrate-binding protein n=1 Tax=Nocardioides gansuensis TaxID=2138300 RepID=A0A2T8FD27_9ACTN|nr:SDR family oxidoreductase [Nocardioides gansuensis]PVG83618.1 ABC transporter substrate-binding protein [Nocardioides gansuensis]
MELGLKGRRALVTGGSKGLGRAIALELAREGAAVAICSRNRAECDAVVAELRALGTTGWAYEADVTVGSDVDRLVEEAASELGGLDILVNNAGGARPGTFETLTDEDWQIDFDTKVGSIIRVCRAALPHLRASSAARIVNIGAVQGKAPDPTFCSTSALRAAGNNLTKVLAQQYGPEGILVNAVNIGLVTTPQWANIRQRKAPHLTADEFAATLTADVPLGRFGRDDEVSGVVTFLASDRASYVTGVLIDVAGGMGRYA